MPRFLPGFALCGILQSCRIPPAEPAGRRPDDAPYVRPFLEDVPQLGVEAISLVLLAYGIGGFFGNLFGGFMAERNTAWAVTIAATLIAASASILVLDGASPVVAGFAIASWGFAFGALLGGVLIDLQGATMVFVFVAIVALPGASLMATRRGVVPQAEASQV